MSIESSECVPTAYFYIGAIDSDEEESLDYESISASYVSMLTQIWNDISNWDNGYNPPLEIAIKILRILKGLRISSNDNKQTVDSYNTFLNNRIAKVSAALQEYKEHLCTKVCSVLEEKDELEHSEIKQEIQQIKTEIENAKLLSNEKKHKIRKRSLLRHIKEAFFRSNPLNSVRKENLGKETEDLHLIGSHEKQQDQKPTNNEEEEEESTSKCLKLCKRKGRK
ncbi:uncharacterized protein [Engystomops pustulosus]|uniref:uncharacterized protein isoform X1 n=1 Tax=Engystomops pustulosus TaxID=76066 RepID=UPI003AFAE882